MIPAKSRSVAPDFTLTDVQGKQMTLSKYKGRLVLLNFWATTCGGCKVELPWYVAFNDKYRTKGLVVIGFDMYGETSNLIKPFMVKWNMDYPVATGPDALGGQFSLKEMLQPCLSTKRKKPQSRMQISSIKRRLRTIYKDCYKSNSAKQLLNGRLITH